MPLPGMMGVMGGFSQPTVLQSFSTASTGNTTTVEVTKPTGTVAGDILVAVMSSSTSLASTWTGDTGFTEIIDENAAPNLRAAYLVAGASEPASYTFTITNSGEKVAHILCFRGYQYDVASASVTTLSGAGDLNIAGITLVGGVLIAVAATRAAGAVTHSTPTGFALVATTPAGTAAFISTFWKLADAGATGTVTSAMGGSATSNGGILIGLKP